MDLSTFLSFDNKQIATLLHNAGSTCWAIALGGTRRAYLAQHGKLTDKSDVASYFQWLEKQQRQIFNQLYDMGVKIIIDISYVPTNRGNCYQSYAKRTIQGLVHSDNRRRWYNQRQLRVRAIGDMITLGRALDIPSLPIDFQRLTEETQTRYGPRLIYFFRGDWTNMATEEAHLGYQLGTQLGRAPTQAELTQAFYGEDIPKLSFYIGSGRPRLDVFRPPFISGSEDCYWSATSPVQLTLNDWRKIIYDHLYLRTTKGNREYFLDETSQRELTLAAQTLNGYILGIGQKHKLGFWMPETHTDMTNQ